jgi:hypothetical protein
MGVDVSKDWSGYGISNLGSLSITNTDNAVLTADWGGRLTVTNRDGYVIIGPGGGTYSYFITSESLFAFNRGIIGYATNTHDIGSPSYSWKDLYVAGNIYQNNTVVLDTSKNLRSIGYVIQPSKQANYYNWKSYKGVLQAQTPAGSGTGMVVINTGIPYTGNVGTMFRIHVKGYDFQTFKVIDFVLAGYITSAPAFSRFTCMGTGLDGLNKYYGVNAEGYFCIGIGDTSTSQYTMSFTVDFEAGWNGVTQEGYATGWTTTLVTDTSGWVVAPTAAQQWIACDYVNSNLIPTTTTKDLGSTSYEWANAYIGSGKLYLGSAQECNLYNSSGTLKTDNNFSCGAITSTSSIVANRISLTDTSGQIRSDSEIGLNTIDGSAYQTLRAKNYRVGTTEVIDASRNLTNIGTVGCGAITSTGLVTATKFHASSNGASDNYRVGDDAFIGDCNTANMISICGYTSGAPNANGGIVFGTGKDTNLYRSGANILKTDDAFQAASYAVGSTSVIDSSRNLTNIGTVGCGAITSTSTITSTKTASGLGGAKGFTWTPSDISGAEISLSQGGSTAGAFWPALNMAARGRSDYPNFWGGSIEPTYDSGTVPVMYIRGYLSTGAAVATRPLLGVYNYTTPLFTIGATGAVGCGAITSSGAITTGQNSKFDLWQFSGVRDFTYNGKRAMVMREDWAPTTLVINYGGDFGQVNIASPLVVSGNLTVRSAVSTSDMGLLEHTGATASDNVTFGLKRTNQTGTLLYLDLWDLSNGKRGGINVGAVRINNSTVAIDSNNDHFARYMNLTGTGNQFRCDNRIQVRNTNNTAYQDIDVRSLYIGGTNVLDTSGFLTTGRINLNGSAPLLYFAETDQTLPAGRWRIGVDGDALLIDHNTALDGGYGSRQRTYFNNFGIYTYGIVQGQIGAYLANTTLTMSASSTVQFNNSTYKSTTDTSSPGTMVKRLKVNYAMTGTFYIKWSLVSQGTGITVYGRLYKNGSALGSSRSTSSTDGVTFTEGPYTNIAAGDEFQIYARTADPTGAAGVWDLQICFTPSSALALYSAIS